MGRGRYAGAAWLCALVAESRKGRKSEQTVAETLLGLGLPQPVETTIFFCCMPLDSNHYCQHSIPHFQGNPRLRLLRIPAESHAPNKLGTFSRAVGQTPGADLCRCGHIGSSCRNGGEQVLWWLKPRIGWGAPGRVCADLHMLLTRTRMRTQQVGRGAQL